MNKNTNKIKLTESQFKKIIKESVIKIIDIINEDANVAYDRSNATNGMKPIWDIIDKKQKELYDMVFGELSEKLDDLTLKKSKLMGDTHLQIPNVICRAGNAKLPESVLIVNMSSALMCPSFYLGLCQIRNGACYAQRQENQYTNNVLPQRFQTDLMHTQMLRQYQNGDKKPMRLYFRIVELYIQLANKYATDKCKQVIRDLEKKRRKPLTPVEKNIIMYEHSKNKITDVRLNETGDFHCQLAVNLWSKFAKKIKNKYGIDTHAYTARNLDFSQASKYINMNYSHKGDYDSEYHEPRYFKVVSDKKYNSLEDVDLDDNNQPILKTDKVGVKYYKCPCTSKESKCEYCGVCYKPNMTNEPYTIYVKFHGQKNAKGLKNGFTIQEIKPVLDKYNEYGWVKDNEKDKIDKTALQTYSDNVLKNRKK